MDAESLTSRIDEAIDLVGTDESSALASAAARQTLEQAGEDDW